jgi:hypothetical protein
MKALSLLQPWASLVVTGVKIIETRSWQTAYRGELLIHASLGKKGSILCTKPPLKKYVPHFHRLPFGAMVGSVVLEDVVPVEMLHISSSKLAALTLEANAFGDHTKGRYAWLFSNPVLFQQPIPVKGTMGLWNYLPQ